MVACVHQHEAEPDRVHDCGRGGDRLRSFPSLASLAEASQPPASHGRERAVGQFLERLRERGFDVFHDVIGRGFNVDHVLVGPAGVFTIETKTWSKPVSGKAQVNFDGEKITAGSFEPDRDPVVQAKAQAGWLKALLLESTGRKLDVRPVIVFPGWFVENASGSFKDIWVLEPKALPSFLSNEPSRLSREDVKLASFHLFRLIRSNERAR
jgi:Nuclease-related domain